MKKVVQADGTRMAAAALLAVASAVLLGPIVAAAPSSPMLQADELEQVTDEPIPWPTEGWSKASPESQGVDPKPFAALDEAVRSGKLGYVDRMVVIRNGALLIDRRYENDYREISRGFSGAMGCGWESCTEADPDLEYNYYHPDTHPYYRGRDVHSLQSVTKSIAATVVGAALHRGTISGLDASLLSFFGDYDLSAVDPRLHRATLEDLLTMRVGMEWHEQDRPADDTNTTLQLEKSADWIRFTLAQPMDSEPGEKWLYNSGASHLMSGIIKQTTGRFIDDYAREVLFAPLGIDELHWKKSPRGFPDTEGGLFLEATQLAKIGFLYLHDGVWDGRRILPEGWVEAATARQAETDNPLGWGYGYQWWQLDRDGLKIWAALGFGGQALFVLPQRQTIGVMNCWNVFDPPKRGMREEFLRALIEATD